MSSPAGQKKADFRSRKSALFFHTGSRVREHDTDGRARAGRALKLDAAVVILHSVLDDRQSEARAAGRLGVALIHAVEALEHTRLMLRRDADAGVGDGDAAAAGIGRDRHVHAPAVTVVLDGVVAEVIDDLIDQAADAGQDGRLPRDTDRHVARGRGVVQVLRRLLRHGEQVDRLRRHGVALVELGQADDIVDERDEARGLGVDMADEARQILGLDHAVFDQLGAADDALQRRFQLVGHVGREFPAAALGVGLLGHIEGQNDAADAVALRLDPADVHLIVPAAAHRPQLAVARLPCRLHRVAHFPAPVDGQKVLPHRSGVGAEHPAGRRIDAQHGALAVQQHQTFLHTGGNLGKFVGFLLQGPHLEGNLAALLVDASQQGRQLLVGIVLQRVLQIQLVEGLYDMLGQPPGQQGRQRQRQHQHDQEGLEHAQYQHARGGAADGDTQHGAVIQALRLIDGLFQQRGGVAAGLALPRQQRLLDLLALAVVLHTGGVGAGKSEILHYLETKDGVKVMLADEIAHELMLPGTECYQKLKDMFSDEDIWNEDGLFDRKKLATVIFSDEKKRDALNGIVHPAVKKYIRTVADTERENGVLKILVLEAALLIEEHYDEICDELWYIYTREDIRKERLMRSRGYSPEKVQQIFDSQLQEAVYRKQCKVVIDNNGTVEDAIRQIDLAITNMENE